MREEDSLGSIDNAVQQALVTLDVPSREDFERLEQAMTQLKQDFIKSLY